MLASKSPAPFCVTSLAEVWIEICHAYWNARCYSVTSLAEVWIEMPKGTVNWKKHTVTSLAEVWIEIGSVHHEAWWMESLPLRKCGLKLI